MEQILKNTSVTLSETFSAGNATGPVLVTITDAAGTVIVNAQPATLDATVPTPIPGRYTYVLAPQPNVAQLTIVWSGTWGGTAMSISQEAEVVGGLLFTLAELRALNNNALADTAAYTDEALADKRATITDKFSDYCDVSFIPRYRRVTIDGGWRTDLMLPNRKVTQVISATIDGTPLTVDELADLTVYETGRVDRLSDTSWSGLTRRNIIVEYEHGYTTPPGTIRDAALAYAYDQLTANTLADRVMSQMTEFGILRQSTAGPNRPTGLLSVDEALNRERDKHTALAIY